ncbi:MAG: chromatin protein Cren7 [Sulfolobales archaeon]
MRRKEKAQPNKCPRCGYLVERPEKTWHLVSPIPDSYGRVTITIMGSFKCPKCGYSWRAVISKLKAGEDVEFVEREERETEYKPREGKVIEIDLSEIYEEE